MRRGLGTSGTTLTIPTPKSEGCQKNRKQDIENLFKKIMEYFPKLAKEIDFQKVQEVQESPKEVGSKEEYTKAHNYPKLKIRRES